MNKTVFVCLLAAVMFIACGEKTSKQEPLAAQQVADKVRDSWLDDRKAIEISLFSENGQPITDLPAIGVHAWMRECTDNESAALCGVEFVKRTNNYMSPDANALCSDTTATINVCFPWHKGAKGESAIHLSAPFGENLYGKELLRTIGNSINIEVQMKSSMAVLRIAMNSDEIQDRLETLHVSGESIYSDALYIPYSGQWFETKVGDAISATDADCMLNNGRHHDFYLIPTEKSSEVTLFAMVNGKPYAVKTTLPPMLAGSQTQLNLRKKGNALALESSWVETIRPLIYNKVYEVDSVMVGHYLQNDGRVVATKDSASVAVVIDTDGKHGKAVALCDADGRFCFSDKQITSGKTFTTLDGKRKDGIINPKQNDEVSDDENIIFKSDMPYGENVALGYGNGAGQTQSLLLKQKEFSLSHVIGLARTGFPLPRTPMLREVAKHPCSYVPSLREMVMVYCNPPDGISALQGEYITSSESGAKTCYMIDMDYGIVSASASKLYSKLQLRLFYLF